MLRGPLEVLPLGWGRVFVVVWMGFEDRVLVEAGAAKLELWKERVSSCRSVWPRSPWIGYVLARGAWEFVVLPLRDEGDSPRRLRRRRHHSLDSTCCCRNAPLIFFDHWLCDQGWCLELLVMGKFKAAPFWQIVGLGIYTPETRVQVKPL